MSSSPDSKTPRSVDLFTREGARRFCRIQRINDAHPLLFAQSAKIGYTPMRDNGPSFDPILHLVLTGVRADATAHTELSRYKTLIDVLSIEVHRESPVQYRMRTVILLVRTSDADKLADILRQLAADTSTIIGSLAHVATGQQENTYPPMACRRVFVDRDGETMTVFIALHVNYQDMPGMMPGWVHSDIVRVDNVTVNDDEDVVADLHVLNNFATIWERYFDPDRHNRRKVR